MALGFPIGSADGGGGGGDFLPIVKYDARSGRVHKVDRTEQTDGSWLSSKTEIKAGKFKFVPDMENVECGWMLFVQGTAPDLRLVRLGDVWPDQPTTDHKRGIRCVIKLAQDLDGSVREFAGNSASFLRGFDALHTDYEAGKAANPDKLPIVVLDDTKEAESKGSKQTSTNYEPVFKIVGWTARPAELKPNLRGSTTVDVRAPSKSPPSTGGTVVKAPELVGAEDYESF